MSDIKRVAGRRQLRNAALFALVVPAALLAGCAPTPAPPPPPAPMAQPAPPPPPPPAAPVVRG
jgi:hypothetical protein